MRPRFAMIVSLLGLGLVTAVASAQSPPVLRSVEPVTDGYALVGTNFGTDKSRLQVFEGGTVVSADRIVSITVDRIVIRGKPSGTVQHKVVVARQTSNVVSFAHQVERAASTTTRAAAAPTLTRVEPTAEGYALVGRDFGADTSRIEVYEGANRVPPERVGAVDGHRIAVRSRPSGTVQHKVVVGGQATAVVAFTHSATPALTATPATRLGAVGVARPTLSTVEPVAGGYALVGSGFGADKAAVQVFEGAAEVPVAQVSSVTDVRITVTAQRSGTVQHRVVVGGQATATIGFDHAGGAALSTVTVSPARLEPDARGEFWVTLSGGNAAAGAVVALSSSANVLLEPAGNVTVPAGQTKLKVVVTAREQVTSPTAATVSAAFRGVTRTAQLELLPVQLTSVGVDAATVGPGRVITGTVRINKRMEGSATIVVPLTASSNAVTISSTATVTQPGRDMFAGQPTTDGKVGGFTIQGGTVTAPTPVTISATYGGVTKTATVTVQPATLAGVLLFAENAAMPLNWDAAAGKPLRIAGGQNVNVVAVFNGAVSASGTVAFSSSNPSAVPITSSAPVSPGAPYAHVLVPTPAGTAPSTVTIAATWGTVTKTADIQMGAPQFTSLALAPSEGGGGGGLPGTVTFDFAAPQSGLAVALSASGGVTGVTVPASVTVAAGQRTAQFNLGLPVVATRATGSVTATYGGVTRSAQFAVRPMRLQAIHLLDGEHGLVGGGTARYLVQLTDGVAPPGGAVVAFASSAAAAPVPATVTVPAGQPSTHVTVATQAVTSPTTVRVIASYNGVAVSNNELVIQPTLALSAFAVHKDGFANAVGGAMAQGKVTLNAGAPGGGTVVTLSSSDPAVASVPASVTVPAAMPIAYLQVDTKAVKQDTRVTISASYAGITKQAVFDVLAPR